MVGLLNHENLSGYDIKKQIENSLSNYWDIGFGQIYPELKKLEKNKMVTCRTEIQEKGPARKLYSITDLGKEELQAWLQRPVEGEKIRFELLLKLYFSEQIPAEHTTDKINKFVERHKNKLSEYKIYKDSLKPVLEDSDDHLYRYLTLLFGIHMEKAFLSWAKEAEKLIKEK